jgi:hypothetical protein
MLKSSQEIPKTARSGLGAVFVSDIWQFVAVFSTSGGGEDFIFGVLIQDESLKSDLLYVDPNSIRRLTTE